MLSSYISVFFKVIEIIIYLFVIRIVTFCLLAFLGLISVFIFRVWGVVFAKSSWTEQIFRIIFANGKLEVVFCKVKLCAYLRAVSLNEFVFVGFYILVLLFRRFIVRFDSLTFFLIVFDILTTDN